jgi:phosphoglucosamine mutase
MTGREVSQPVQQDHRLFGTDGIRAPFGSPPLDQSTVTALGYHIATRLAGESSQPRVILAGDTRSSTPEICSWLAHGLYRAGAEVLYAGVLPTPGVSCLINEFDADAGVAVSASHNPHPDNGIKLFDREGFKADDESERDLEQRLRRGAPEIRSSPQALKEDSALAERYLRRRQELLGGERPLDGLRVVVDAANGAASVYAAPLFRRLGAQVVSLCDQPDGRNINADCGSTRPEGMARQVVENRCHLGIAFDGDADRALFADESGRVRDGDALLYLWARHLKQQGLLAPPSVVATTMSNLGLERALEREGIGMVRCDVGDRTVVRTMRREGILLGGEQSGHLVHLGRTTTGDGLVTALEISSVLLHGARPMSDQLSGFRRFPQILRNVQVSRKPELASLPGVTAAVRHAEEHLANRGRLVLRYSGTEPLARIMIEGPELPEIEALAARLTEALRQDLEET